MRLTGRQQRELSEALRDAFDPPSLARMLVFRLERKLVEYAPPAADFRHQVFELIRASQQEGWTAALIAAARAANPGNARLHRFAERRGMASSPPSGEAFERVISERSRFLDVMQWREELAVLEARVCRIVVPTGRGVVYGTGFLVGPDRVLTNDHVVAPVVAGAGNGAAADGLRADPSDVRVEFDHLVDPDGNVLHGPSFGLAGERWLIDRSPPSPHDAEPEPKGGEPTADELDFALLRLDGDPGDGPIGENGSPADPPRGWIELPRAPVPIEAGSPLFILQHPQGEPLKLAFHSEGVIGPNANGTRVKHRVDTLAGSSGSPCFDQDWRLIALHHSGDPNFDPAHRPEYNQAIPCEKIAVRLAAKAVAGGGD